MSSVFHEKINKTLPIMTRSTDFTLLHVSSESQHNLRVKNYLNQERNIMVKMYLCVRGDLPRSEKNDVLGSDT